MADQLFYGSLYGTPQGNSSNSVIRVSGNISGNTITGTAVSGYLGLDSAAVGMVVRWGANTRTITAVNAGNVVVDGAAITASATFRISPAEGNYYMSASVFSDPNSELTVNSITGSLDNEFSGSQTAFAVLGKADGKVGRYHQYKISQVVARDTSNSTISFFMDWNESGSEAGSGDTLSTNLQYMSITEITNNLNISPIFSRRVGDLTNLEVGADQAGFQILAQDLDDFSTGSFTGSFHGEFSGSLTGSFEGIGSGSFSGSYEGSIRSTDTVASGSFSGSYEGSVRSKDFVGTGSFTGSGHIDISNTASSAEDFLVRGDATVRGDIEVLGTGSFGFIHTLYQSSSIIFSSGSTKFGDTTDDTHEFTGSISAQGGLVDFTDATEVEGDFSGSFRGDGSGLTDVDFFNLANKPTLVSSSAQIADDISGSFVAPSASIGARITSVSASFSTSQTNISASFSTSQTNISSSSSTKRDLLNTRITNVSASFSTDITSISSSIATDITNIEEGVVLVTSASYAVTASYVEERGLEQDVRITGSLIVSGSETNNDASVTVRNGYVFLENIPEFATITEAVNAGIPSNAVVKITGSGIPYAIDGGNIAYGLYIID